MISYEINRSVYRLYSYGKEKGKYAYVRFTLEWKLFLELN